MTHLKNSRVRYYAAFAGILLIYFLNLFIDVMDVDAAQYASISREMLETNSWLQVLHRGADYLDKPPLLFWLSAVSLKIFGIHNFAYKLPSVLILLLGMYSFYRLALLFYDRKTAVAALLIVLTTQAWFQITNDIRTDTILIGMLFFALWQLYEYIRKERFINLLAASVGIAGAMMAKGPIALIILGAAFGGDLLLKKDFRNIFRFQWLILLAIVLVLLLPMCYGLYQQFDLHPEKVVYELKGPSGVKFFFWTQSFGRITGDIYWNNHTGYFYFFQTLAWDFQPWLLLLIPAFYVKIKRLVKSGIKSSPEYFSITGSILTFFALSLSAYKLPHYIFPVFPFFALIIAEYLYRNFSSQPVGALKRLGNIQLGILHLLFIVPVFAFFFVFGNPGIVLPVLIVILFAIFWRIIIKTKNKADRLLFAGVVAMLAFGLTLSTYFYPNLLKYQPEGDAGRFISKLKIPEDQFYRYKSGSHALDFYSQRIVPDADSLLLSTYKSGTYIYTGEESLNQLTDSISNYKIVEEYNKFNVTGLKPAFLNKNTRKSTLQKKYLLVKK